jgi:hypothetical protein
VLYFNSRGAYALIAHDHYVGNHDWGLALNNTPLSVFCTWFGVTFGKIDLFNQQPVLFSVNFKDFADFAFVLAGNYLDLIVFFYQYLFLEHFLFSQQ